MFTNKSMSALQITSIGIETVTLPMVPLLPGLVDHWTHTLSSRTVIKVFTVPSAWVSLRDRQLKLRGAAYSPHYGNVPVLYEVERLLPLCRTKEKLLHFQSERWALFTAKLYCLDVWKYFSFVWGMKCFLYSLVLRSNWNESRSYLRKLKSLQKTIGYRVTRRHFPEHVLFLRTWKCKRSLFLNFLFKKLNFAASSLLYGIGTAVLFVIRWL